MLQQPFTIKTVETGLNYGRYEVEPLQPGYGTTLGNALRRILLRSLEGCAVSRIRIDNVWHEFASVPNVREDVTAIVLNLKGIRLRQVTELHGDGGDRRPRCLQMRLGDVLRESRRRQRQNGRGGKNGGKAANPFMQLHDR